MALPIVLFLVALVAGLSTPGKRLISTAAALPGHSEPADSLTGEWGWIADGPGCRDNPHVISFTPDGRHMVLTYRELFDSTGLRAKRYEIRGRTANSVRGFVISPPETRRTPTGELVVWDLALTAPDVYQWHRTDWPEDGFTRAIVRCSNLRAPASDPEGTARFILEAMAGGDFLLAAEHTEPSELRRNRLAFDSLLSADSTNYLALRIFDIPSKAQLLRISDAEFTARLFTFQTLLRTDRSFLANVRGAQTLGFVSRGEDTAHVVFRWRLPRDSVQLRSADVFTMVRSGGRWWAQTMGNYSGIIQVLQEPMVRVPPPRMP